MRWRWDRIELGAALLLAIRCLALRIADPAPAGWMRLYVFDEFQRQFSRPVPPVEAQPVVIIDIDEASLAEIGQ